jgi:hypothetical protein
VGWETPEQTADRFEQAVLRNTSPDQPLIIASHGMAMTAWLLHCRRAFDPQSAGRFWMNLSFPDVIEVA